MAIAWESLFVYDCVIFAFTIYKTSSRRRNHMNIDISRTRLDLSSLMFRDGEPIIWCFKFKWSRHSCLWRSCIFRVSPQVIFELIYDDNELFFRQLWYRAMACCNLANTVTFYVNRYVNCIGCSTDSIKTGSSSAYPISSKFQWLPLTVFHDSLNWRVICPLSQAGMRRWPHIIWKYCSHIPYSISVSMMSRLLLNLHEVATKGAGGIPDSGGAILSTSRDLTPVVFNSVANTPGGYMDDEDADRNRDTYDYPLRDSRPVWKLEESVVMYVLRIEPKLWGSSTVSVFSWRMRMNHSPKTFTCAVESLY